MIPALVSYVPMVILIAAIFVASYGYCFGTYIDDVPQPDDDCPFWKGDPP